MTVARRAALLLAESAVLRARHRLRPGERIPSAVGSHHAGVDPLLRETLTTQACAEDIPRHGYVVGGAARICHRALSPDVQTGVAA